MAINLTFHTTHSFSYPVGAQVPPETAPTGLTVCRVFNDPSLAFLTQSTNDDDLVFVSLADGNEYLRHVTPPGRETISGLAYNRFADRIWCSLSTTTPDEVIAIDPDTGNEVAAQTWSANIHVSVPQGLGCNGLFFTRCYSEWIELRTMGGIFIADKRYPGRIIRGLTAAHAGWCYVDNQTDELVVIGPFGNEAAIAPAPGAAGGCNAIAFDDITDHRAAPQVWLENGTIGAVGTINHPDTPWNPTPWLGRHRIYIANNVDEIVYAGYLTAN
ncbi:MAG: hypothetical protein ACE5EU_04760 [Paracoccaceae bacterium]